MRKIHLASVDSTNSWAKEQAVTIDGDAFIYSDDQRAGYGRFGRQWCSPAASNLAFSLLLSPTLPPERWPNCSQVVAVAVASYFVEVLGLTPTLKWPNDILFGEKKAVGILAETLQLGSAAQRLIVGVGINVRQNPELAAAVDRPVVSLQEMGADIDALDLATALEPLLEEALAEYCRNGFAAFAAVWRRLGEEAGRRVVLLNGESSIEGTIAAVNDDGSLGFRDSAGALHRVAAGEIEYITSEKG